VLFGGTDGAGLPGGLLVLDWAGTAADTGRCHWRAEAVPATGPAAEGRLSVAAGTLLRGGGGGGRGGGGGSLLVFGGVTSAADLADVFLLTPPQQAAGAAPGR
jgi:hypothetical protein